MRNLTFIDEFSPYYSPDGLSDEFPWKVFSWEAFETFFPFPFPILVCFMECAAIFLIGPFFYMFTLGGGQGQSQGKGGADIRHLTNAAAAHSQAQNLQAQANNVAR